MCKLKSYHKFTVYIDKINIKQILMEGLNIMMYLELTDKFFHVMEGNKNETE